MSEELTQSIEITGEIKSNNNAVNKYIENFESQIDYNADSYKVNLEVFEGPLDLLLILVKKAKISIQDIFVSQITEQYLIQLNALKLIDIDRASDFIEVAAQLIEIKSKSLLPKLDNGDDNTIDEKKEFIQRLEEYRIYKEACQKMKEQETIGIHYREPDPTVGDFRFVLKDMTMNGLLKALQKMFLKLDKKAISSPERKLTLDRFTVSEKISHIKDAMLIRDTVSFIELFEEDYSKSEIITTFQALLELLKMQFVTADQKEIFGDIILHKVKDKYGN